LRDNGGLNLVGWLDQCRGTF